jgi:hypothetical protein
MIDPEIGFTSDVIKDSSRFVGRTDSTQYAFRLAGDLWETRRREVFSTSPGPTNGLGRVRDRQKGWHLS